MKTGKWIVGVLVVAVAATAGWLYFGRSDSSDTYATAPVKRGDVSASVAATGTANPVITVTVGSQISGQVSNLYADFNSVVKKGQVVARIEPSNLEAQMARDRAQLSSSHAALERARVAAENKRLAFERAKRLQAQDLIPQADFDTAQADYATSQADVKTAQASIAQAQASLRISQVNLDHATIVSPVDGTVISRNVDVGQTVAASLQAPTLFTIAQDLRRMEVHMNVAESDIGKLAVGQVATFTVDAYPQDRFRGTISEIRNSPTTLQNVVTYEAVIGVDNSEMKLKPGMTANVSVVVAQRDDALLVPNAALRFKPPEGVGVSSATEARGGPGSSGASGAGESSAGASGTPGGSGAGASGEGGSPGETDGQGPRGGRRWKGGGREGGGGGTGDADADPQGAGKAGDRAGGAEAAPGGPGAGGSGGGRGGFGGGGRGGRSTSAVWVLRPDGRLERVTVRVGITDGSFTEIVSGDLEEGDKVATEMLGAQTAAAGANRGTGGRGFGRMF